MVNVGREAMLAIGCIQAQRRHTGTCPTGVATQNPGLARGPDPHRRPSAANYVVERRRDLLKLSEAVGVAHPGLLSPLDIDIPTACAARCRLRRSRADEGWGELRADLAEEIEELMGAHLPPEEGAAHRGLMLPPEHARPWAAGGAVVELVAGGRACRVSRSRVGR